MLRSFNRIARDFILPRVFAAGRMGQLRRLVSMGEAMGKEGETEKNFNDAVGAAATSVRAREREREREKETRFRRILNDSLTHQTVPSFLLGPKLREFFLNYSRTAYGNYLGPPPRAFKSQSWKTCPFIVFRGA